MPASWLTVHIPKSIVFLSPGPLEFLQNLAQISIDIIIHLFLVYRGIPFFWHRA